MVVQERKVEIRMSALKSVIRIADFTPFIDSQIIKAWKEQTSKDWQAILDEDNEDNNEEVNSAIDIEAEIIPPTLKLKTNLKQT